MLVLKRKIGETVVIGDDIQVQILGIEGETVKLGFLAPKDIEILRHELYEDIKKENIEATQQKYTQDDVKNILDTLLDPNIQKK